MRFITIAFCWLFLTGFTYTEKVTIDRITILSDGQFQIRQVTKVLRDGIEIAKSYWRGVLTPDQDLDKVIISPKITEADKNKVKAVAGLIWTQEVKSKYIANKAVQMFP